MALKPWPDNPAQHALPARAGQAVEPLQQVRAVQPAKPPAASTPPQEETRRRLSPAARLAASWAGTWLTIVVLCLLVARHEVGFGSLLAGSALVATVLVAAAAGRIR
jgi:hypothetical protein